MSLFGSKEKKEIAELKENVARLRTLLSPEQQELQRLSNALPKAREEYETILSDLSAARSELDEVKARVVYLSEQEIYEEVSLYESKYDFATAVEYKLRLDEVRSKQKALIKNKTATNGSKNWTVNEDRKKGQKMVADMQKLLLRAFNSECEYIIDRISVNNVEVSEKRMLSSYEAITNLGKMLSISISKEYFQLKAEELYLALEYRQKKQEEKEALREVRARQREEAKLAKEIEEERKKLEKEQKHYKKALSDIINQIAAANETAVPALIEKKSEIERHLAKIDADFAKVDYRAANIKAGYVYIISNIGAFGEGVYKIGMTRRLDPMDRIDELGDASVPFDFDVHALIFSQDAPALEAALHNAFADKKLNFINKRREFFRVSLDEIKQVVRENFDRTIEFIDVPPAEQYRQSLAYRNQQNKKAAP